MTAYIIYPVLLFNLIFSTTKYISKDGSYSFYIDSNYELKELPIKNGKEDFFRIINTIDKSQTNYFISVTRTPDNIHHDVNELSDYTYKDGFLKTCNCSITEAKQITYRGFSSVLFEIEINNQGTKFKGVSVSTLKNQQLYNITFLADPTKFTIYKQDFESLLNSMEIYK